MESCVYLSRAVMASNCMLKSFSHTQPSCSSATMSGVMRWNHLVYAPSCLRCPWQVLHREQVSERFKHCKQWKLAVQKQSDWHMSS